MCLIAFLHGCRSHFSTACHVFFEARAHKHAKGDEMARERRCRLPG